MLTPDCNENYGLKLALCLSCRSEDKLEPRFNFEGHQLGVVSVDINLTGTRILLAHKTFVDFNLLLLVDLSGPGLLNFWYLSFKCINYDCNKMDFQSCALRKKMQGAQCSEPVKPKVPCIMISMNKQRFSCHQGAKIGFRGHQGTSSAQPWFQIINLISAIKI